MGRTLRNALAMLLVMTLVTGVIYPMLVTGIAQLLFPAQANGSLVLKGGRPVGSALLGQAFTAPGYFWGRPSATQPRPYDGASSGGSNLGPANPVLRQAVQQRIRQLRAADPGNPAPIPVDLVTASASGLDPDISPAAAQYQVARVARARGLPPGQVQALVAAHTAGRQWGIFGERRVNVLELNLALDGLQAR
ncbi:MAG TPA: potassium-transporting ATPase subunit KdpC [Frateuria sp.]|uniref:potassium-transporting ATPase subunit KdpC n=1 Tax=Frateuria sp. TaxID=2211372 RepID=UPI002DE245DD|nr:potassium-transporting ATPase subunit KdpC [Frateuria sp.]